MRILIIGAGEVGYTIASRLVSEGEEVVIIESDPVRKQYCNNTLDLMVYEGSGSNPSLLIEAGIKLADMVVAVTHSDEVNITTCLLAKVLAPNAIRLARIRNTKLSSLSDLYSPQGEDLALPIYPETLSAQKVLSLLKCNGAVDYISFSDGLLSVLGICIPHGSKFAGRTLMDLGKNEWGTKVLVTAVKRGSEVLIPRGNLVINAGDTIYTVTTPSTITEVMELLGSPVNPIKTAMIYGSSNVALAILKGCNEQNISTKIIEPSLNKCQELTNIIPPETIILHGEGTDEELLKSENISEMDVFICCSNDDESNVLAAVLAKRIGAKTVIVVTNKMIFIPILASNGILTTVSPRSMAVGSILQYIRRGRVLSVQPFFDDSAEFIEFVVPDAAPIAGQMLKNCKVPHEAVIAAIIRQGDTITPHGDTTIEVSDRVLVLTKRKAVHKVEEFFTTKAQ